MIVNDNDVFLGTGWSFPPTFQTSGKEVEMVSYEQDIKESLHILLSTSPGERIMQPSFGCDLKKILLHTCMPLYENTYHVIYQPSI